MPKLVKKRTMSISSQMPKTSKLVGPASQKQQALCDWQTNPKSTTHIVREIRLCTEINIANYIMCPFSIRRHKQHHP